MSKEHPLRIGEVSVAVVDDAERVVRRHEARLLDDCLARVPVRVVSLAHRQRLDRAVVHVHRDDRGLVDHPDALTVQVGRRQEALYCLGRE